MLLLETWVWVWVYPELCQEVHCVSCNDTGKPAHSGCCSRTLRNARSPWGTNLGGTGCHPSPGVWIWRPAMRQQHDTAVGIIATGQTPYSHTTLLLSAVHLSYTMGWISPHAGACCQGALNSTLSCTTAVHSLSSDVCHLLLLCSTRVCMAHTPGTSSVTRKVSIP